MGHVCPDCKAAANVPMPLICSLALIVLCDPAYCCLFAIMQLTILFAISL